MENNITKVDYSTPVMVENYTKEVAVACKGGKQHFINGGKIHQEKFTIRVKPRVENDIARV